MKEKILYIAASLDGYIARKDDSIDWLNSEKLDDVNYDQFFNEIDVVLTGYRTYDVINKISEKWPYENKITYVITNRNIKDKDNIKFVSGKIEEIINNIEKSFYGKIWVCGGSSIIKQMLEMNLIDKFIIYVFPIILGDGIRLFNNLSKEIKLKLVDTKRFNDVVELVYNKTK